MPQYFFEITDNELRFPDPEGSELADDHAARQDALQVLGQRARDEMPDGDAREFAVDVTDADHRPLLKASLTLRVEYASGYRPAGPDRLPLFESFRKAAGRL